MASFHLRTLLARRTSQGRSVGVEAWPANMAVEDDELHAEEGVLGNELGIAASEIEGRAEKDRIAKRPGELEGSP
jgi:hypothetical protein